MLMYNWNIVENGFKHRNPWTWCIFKFEKKYYVKCLFILMNKLAIDMIKQIDLLHISKLLLKLIGF